MSFSEPFIRRPVATALLALAVFASGAAGYFQLPVAPVPRIDVPTVNVQAQLPGASPENMASAVAMPLERRFGRIAGLTELTSSSTLGTSSMTLQFDLDRDVDSAARDVQAAINAAGGDLPPNLPNRPRYQKVNPADAPILILSLTSQTLPLSQVFDAANAVLAQKIAQVPGVGQVFVGGGQQPAVRVEVDPEALSGAGLTFADVRAALASATLDAPKGALSGRTLALPLAANDQLFHAKAFEPLIIRYQDGAALRLRDVATAVDSVENERAAGWIDGKRGVVMVIRRQPGANILSVIDRVKALLPQLATSISPSIDVGVAFDRAQTIRASVRDVEITLVIAVCLVVLVVFVFLRSGWATIVPSVAVPLSLTGTFGVMYLLGYSLDNLSLMALTISTGFVVDDAIVVTENVTRFLEAGKPPLEAALLGAKQIGFTIVSITASLLAVFIPILLMGGIVGRLFREFAVTLSIAIAISAVISLTLTPMMCARLLGREQREHGRWWHASERAFDFVRDGYRGALRWVLGRGPLMLLVVAATVALTVYLFMRIPKGLFPQQDTGQLMGFSDAPQDISFPAMVARQEALNRVIGADPAVSHYVSFIGAGPGGGSINTGTTFIELVPIGQRKASADQVIARLRKKLAAVAGIQLFLQAQQDVRLGGRFTRTQYQYTLKGADLGELATWAPRILDRLRGLPELKDVASDQQTNGLQLDVAVDRDTAARLGIQAQTVDDALYDAFGQRQVATLFTQLNQYRVVLEAAGRHRQGPAALDRLFVRSAAGAPVPLAALARWKESRTALSVNHQGQFPAVTISFNLAPGKSLGDAVSAIHRAEQAIAMPASIQAAFSGTAEAFRESLGSEPALIAFALFAVYIVLGVLYESLIHPITILSTLPSAGVGALLALLLFRTELSVMALIGIILLIGIVKKNAIMMIDFAIEAERDEGLSAHEAIYRAACLRFRPILMTTLAALLGAVPLAISGGAGSEMRRPLGITIVGGLAVSQLITLFSTPVIYLAFDRFSKRRRE